MDRPHKVKTRKSVQDVFKRVEYDCKPACSKLIQNTLLQTHPLVCITAVTAIQYRNCGTLNTFINTAISCPACLKCNMYYKEKNCTIVSEEVSKHNHCSNMKQPARMHRSKMIYHKRQVYKRMQLKTPRIELTSFTISSRNTHRAD